jgi:glycosyltransferase involved in cell wall biosynthesis
MKILFVNNYAMNRVWDLWQNGEWPAHHLWGITHLKQHGIDVDILPYEKYVRLKKIMPERLGDLDQQVRMLLGGHPYDLIYSGCQTTTILLSWLRCLRILPTPPIIATIHHPLGYSFRNRLFVGGHSKLLCLSRGFKQQIENSFGRLADGKLELLEWGADLSFYHFDDSVSRKNGGLIVSAGTSKRDYETLVRAARDINCRVKIYCSVHSAPAVSPLPSNVRVYAGDGTYDVIAYRELFAEYEQAAVVAIPLKDIRMLAGLTSLLDAMLAGKPVIMTKNTGIDIDIEAAGIGLWVEPGDVRGWRDAIDYLTANPEKARDMGKRGRELCETRYNLDRFSSQLAQAIQKTV